ncbi:MAG TPA: cellulose binding domain-containing protein [Glycomyces sp.]|nr:cellulose binding domain-containing protein [Glycomyces sp.]
MDERTDEVPERTGRLHGRLLKVLALVSVAAALVALWQLSPVLFQDDEDAAATWPWQDQASVDFADEEPSSTEAAVDSAEARSPSAEPSPEVSSVAPEPEPAPESSEAPPATEDPEPDPEPEHGGPACTASLQMGNQWRDSGEVRFDAWLEVTNTGEEPIEGWEVVLALDGVDVFASWGMRHEGEGRYEAARWNDELAPGKSTAAGFQASAENEVDLPATVPCTAFA